jgi:hypothetical protein
MELEIVALMKLVFFSTDRLEVERVAELMDADIPCEVRDGVEIWSSSPMEAEVWLRRPRLFEAFLLCMKFNIFARDSRDPAEIDFWSKYWWPKCRGRAPMLPFG